MEIKAKVNMRTRGFLKIIFIGLTLSSISVLTSGCKLSQIMPKNQKYTPSKPLVEVIEDVDFAQLLLVPAKTSLNIKRDPFEPLEQMGSELTTGQDTAAHFEVNYLGSIRIGDQISALLKTAEGKDVFKIGDAVSGFTIMEINEEHIVFQKEDKTITINKGAI